MDQITLKNVKPLGFVWETNDPFLFCVHHLDHYPKGNDQLGPAASLEGRDIGQDFTLKDGWRMYHGDLVPGFPAHPHRGFETYCISKKQLNLQIDEFRFSYNSLDKEDGGRTMEIMRNCERKMLYHKGSFVGKEPAN